MSVPRRRAPQRTCVACRQVRAKRDLVRIVLGLDGRVVVDLTGRQNGRGAYLCKQRSCWDAALARGILDRALKTTVQEESRSVIRTYGATLPEHLPEVAAETK